MSEHYDELIGEAFGEFTSAAAPSVRAAGTAAVRSTVAHRRKARLMTFSVLGALLLAVPVTALAANPWGNNGPPHMAASDGPTTPVPSPSAEPSPPPPRQVQSPDGRITLDQLTSVDVTVPAWAKDFARCKSGSVRLKKTGPAQNDLVVNAVVHTNLDSDPQLETAAVLLCLSGDPSPEMVVAFDRDHDGKIVTLGRILGGGGWDDVDFVQTMSARPDGGINVRACIGGCGSDPTDNMYQNREYAWDGSEFARVK
ncbi:hypothetical protein [Allorhizocola rhizosphaerae]|uniref:hypothetical protein n=1 Tax=Allorhizocola rhizosphaerae TaxID=1872709 RepID=UPI000E3D19CC|nr:hypothetical protein [Allorhizocola rhizosphaerae]